MKIGRSPKNVFSDFYTTFKKSKEFPATREKDSPKIPDNQVIHKKSLDNLSTTKVASTHRKFQY